MTSIPIEDRPRPAARRLALSIPRVRPELAGLLLLAAVLNLWALDRNGVANDYYAAAVQAMSASWHAFLYGSFDATGLMTIDKPPLALWVQALSVRLFGFTFCTTRTSSGTRPRRLARRSRCHARPDPPSMCRCRTQAPHDPE